MDWSLRVCSRRGHETYAPDEPALAERLRAGTAAGETWRCLRCGDFVPGPPKGSGPADNAPEVPRGRLLRDRTIMRLLAAERVARGLVLIFVAGLVLYFRESHAALERAFDNELSLFRPLAEQIGWDLDRSAVLHGISRIFAFTPQTLVWIAIGLCAYAGLLFVESYGLWRVRRWGEYFSVVVTSVFLPWEIYEVTEKFTGLKLLLMLVNLAAVVWLIWSKRLFGVRGGGAAYRAEHSAESLLTVERSALADSGPVPQQQGLSPAGPS
ncbi:DUF2127 domain-containing protein [Nakamurella sp. GG22]